MKINDFWLFLATIPDPLGDEKNMEEFDPAKEE